MAIGKLTQNSRGIYRVWNESQIMFQIRLLEVDCTSKVFILLRRLKSSLNIPAWRRERDRKSGWNEMPAHPYNWKHMGHSHLLMFSQKRLAWTQQPSWCITGCRNIGFGTLWPRFPEGWCGRLRAKVKCNPLNTSERFYIRMYIMSLHARISPEDFLCICSPWHLLMFV